MANDDEGQLEDVSPQALSAVIGVRAGWIYATPQQKFTNVEDLQRSAPTQTLRGIELDFYELKEDGTRVDGTKTFVFDDEEFVKLVNVVLELRHPPGESCGHDDYRMPTPEEMRDIVSRLRQVVNGEMQIVDITDLLRGDKDD